MKKRLILVLILAMAIGGALWWRSRQHAAASGALYGNVDIREANLGFRVSGRIAEVAVDEGDPVTPGQVLARLDDAPFQRELEEAKARVASARARLSLLEAGNRPEEIAQGRAILREREVTSANAERVFRRQEELYGSKTVTVQERDDAEARLREAEARVKSATEQVRLLEAGFRKEDIEQAKAELARAEAAVAAAELRVADAKLVAGKDGVVLTRAREPGAVVQAGETVLAVSLRKPVWVRAYIPEPDLGRIHPGARVEILTDSRPGKPYSGQVGYISPRAEFTPKNVETPDLRTSLIYRFRVVVEDADESLRQGMPVTLRLPVVPAR